MKHITFYLDFVSPYAWLAYERLPDALEGLSYSVAYRPILLGALLTALLAASGIHATIGGVITDPQVQSAIRQVETERMRSGGAVVMADQPLR